MCVSPSSFLCHSKPDFPLNLVPQTALTTDQEEEEEEPTLSVTIFLHFVLINTKAKKKRSMACNHKAIFCVLFVLSIFLASSKVAQMRPLVEQVKWKQQGLVLQSLPKGGPSTSSPNPCTYVSRHGKGTCTMNGMNVAGSVLRSPPNFPGLTVDVSVASEGHHLDEQYQSSSLASV